LSTTLFRGDYPDTSVRIRQTRWLQHPPSYRAKHRSLFEYWITIGFYVGYLWQSSRHCL